ncbi:MULTISPECIES: Hsp20/alpha crystallin family protein [Paenibacillus]|uniref:Heat-shock protein Hsp20 n=1 Tax=Paenibacillus azoreducens TaxID=116718 RepID=A0A919Y5U8_9BACL|nr:MULTISPECIES: Hsp20/alpha crystallin family protein [Paenibacillus]MBE9917594.1 Hsp20/alpha crystallin family protein [Paenibacillus donghaensis]GIO45486.1 heat-shock protein Hsp20 [Paenibacillus azoreducens]
MPLVPYEPFRHLDNIRREMDRFFTNDLPSFKGFPQNFGQMNVDIYEMENEVIAACDIPGLEKKEDVTIEVDHNMLSISGTVNKSNEVKEENMHRRERYSGRFHRLITLPSDVSPEGVKATYKNGVLEVRMRKIDGDNRKKVDVEFH